MLTYMGRLAAASCLLLGSLHGAQLPRAGKALGNDVYLPTSAPATEALVRGDREVLQALQEGPGAAEHLINAFEAWHDALAGSAQGEAVPVGIQLAQADRASQLFETEIASRWPDRDRSFGRRTEAVELAVLRRLCGLDELQRATWRERFDPLARESQRTLHSSLQVTLSTQRLGYRQLEREFPGTESALRADLWLFEDALEAGHPRSARVWLERAGLQAGLVGGDRWGASLGRRRKALDLFLEGPSREAPAWTTAQDIQPLAGHALTLPLRTRSRGRPGLAFLDDGRVVVQKTGSCWILAPRKKDRIFAPWRLAHELGHPIPDTVGRTGNDWPHLPLAAGDALYMVSGRTDGHSSNLIQRIQPPREIELPRARWSLGGEGLFVEGGPHLPLEPLIGAGIWEFQPGPILVEDTLFVQARQWTTTEQDGNTKVNSPGEARVWLLALDANTGVPRWKQFLCRGTDLTEDYGGRFGRGTLIRTPAQPLRATGTMIFVGTNLGAGFFLDLADGRLVTSFSIDRRPAGKRGWQNGTRPTAWESPREDHPAVLWAPADGSELLALRAGLDFAPREVAQPDPLVTRPPLDLGESETFLGGEFGGAFVFGRAGARRTLSSHHLGEGSRLDSIYLGSDELPFPGALVSDSHVLFATDSGLYRLDRHRELYLDLFHPLRLKSKYASGGLWSRGDLIYLLAEGSLYRFRAN